MSASWGLDIEQKLRSKAEQIDLNTLNSDIQNLQSQIDSISGGDSDTSLGSLALRVSETESELEFLLGSDGTDEEPSSEGKIAEIEKSITDLGSEVKNTYVTKESITTDSDDTVYIFVKQAVYDSDVEEREKALKAKVETDEVSTPLINTTQVTISDVSITSTGTSLFVDSEEVALVKDVPKIMYLTQAKYDEMKNKGELKSDTYYYTTSDENYITRTEFQSKSDEINDSILDAGGRLNTLTTTVGQLETLIGSLSATVESLKSRLDALETTSDKESDEV
jgi:hypothetical protein